MSDYTEIARATSLSGPREQVLVSDLNPKLEQHPAGCCSRLASVVRPKPANPASVILFSPSLCAHVSTFSRPLRLALLFANPSLPTLQHTAASVSTHHHAPAMSMLLCFSYLCGVDATSDLHLHVTSELTAAKEQDAYGGLAHFPTGVGSGRGRFSSCVSATESARCLGPLKWKTESGPLLSPHHSL